MQQNLNANVRVKMNELGRKIYADHFHFQWIPGNPFPKEDSSGYVEMPMWMAMKIFGPFMLSTVEIPIDPVIDVVLPQNSMISLLDRIGTISTMKCDERCKSEDDKSEECDLKICDIRNTLKNIGEQLMDIEQRLTKDQKDTEPDPASNVTAIK